MWFLCALLLEKSVHDIIISLSANGITGCHPESYWTNFLLHSIIYECMIMAFFVVVFLTLTFCKHRPVSNIQQPVIPLTDCDMLATSLCHKYNFESLVVGLSPTVTTICDIKIFVKWSITLSHVRHPSGHRYIYTMFILH